MLYRSHHYRGPCPIRFLAPNSSVSVLFFSVFPPIHTSSLLPSDASTRAALNTYLLNIHIRYLSTHTHHLRAYADTVVEKLIAHGSAGAAGGEASCDSAGPCTHTTHTCMCPFLPKYIPMLLLPVSFAGCLILFD